MIYFTADTHFYHNNILRFDNRPWETMEEMNEALRRRWNYRVHNNDTVYILGDFSWKSSGAALDFLKTLKGKKRLITGNHDTNSKEFYDLFESVKDFDRIKVPVRDGTTRTCILSHYFMPLYPGHWNGAIHLHGHSHNTKEHMEELRIAAELNRKGFPTEIYNVGCMHWNYQPVTLDEMREKR